MPPSDEERTRFIADAMLGSLARKLRALGFDTSYYRSGDDAGIIDVATREGRIILTSDRSLASRTSMRGPNAILVTGRSDGVRVGTIARSAREMGICLVRGEPLCSVCGGELETLSRKDVAGKVPPSVEGRHRLFYKCLSCGQLYWRGGHWKKLRSLARRLGVK